MFEKKTKGIDELKSFISGEAAATTIKCRDYTEYLREVRVPLNNMIISLTVGGTIKANKKGIAQLHFNRPLPSREEVNEIRKAVDTFITVVEKPFLDKVNVDANDDDMSIPPFDGSDNCRINIPKVDKVTNKILRGYVFGQDGKVKISEMLMNGNDVNELAALGEQLRKRRNLHLAMIIGGITLVAVTGGAVAGVVMHNKKKKEENGDYPVLIDALPEDDSIDSIDTADDVDADVPPMVKLA